MKVLPVSRLHGSNKVQDIHGCGSGVVRGCWLSTDTKHVSVAAEQAKELIVIPGLLGWVYAITNLGTCLFAWD